eukprot:CAMPEP_0184531130 /NCGR_PEP_ID=MMETSP0198_2-20121128/13368_1 /TAXON_ID=1112570 /ORGANISM="Thraustochytrium sp., Strain LLF1b" /LENGTH=169 /DNA_ID=CAMNT_0026923437 /DNA_START=971 /DNA_END=1477 /DNA_ORIENTATION=+
MNIRRTAAAFRPISRPRPLTCRFLLQHLLSLPSWSLLGTRGQGPLEGGGPSLRSFRDAATSRLRISLGSASALFPSKHGQRCLRRKSASEVPQLPRVVRRWHFSFSLLCTEFPQDVSPRFRQPTTTETAASGRMARENLPRTVASPVSLAFGTLRGATACTQAKPSCRA